MPVTADGHGERRLQCAGLEDGRALARQEPAARPDLTSSLVASTVWQSFQPIMDVPLDLGDATMKTKTLACCCLLALLACTGAAVAEPEARRSTVCTSDFHLVGSNDMSSFVIHMNNDGGTCGAPFDFNFDSYPVMPEAVIKSPPASGTPTATVTDGGKTVMLAYTPAPGFTGTDEFSVVFRNLPTRIRGMRVRVTVDQK